MLRAASLWASVLSTSAHALADDSPTQKLQTANTVPASSGQSDGTREGLATSASTEQLAANAYQQALVSYAKGDVPAALDSMRESYQLSKRAELLYNLA